MRRKLRALLRIAIGAIGPVVLAACPQQVAVWVRSGAMTGNLVLDLGTERGVAGEVDIGLVAVWKCTRSSKSDSAMVWRILARPTSHTLRSIRYGIAPDGFSVEVSPLPIEPGCYVAQVAETGATRFRVAPDGSVIDEGDPW